MSKSTTTDISSNTNTTLIGVHGFPVSAQRFVFLGRELLDHELAVDCHVENECTIHLILRTNEEVHVQIVENNNDNSNENNNNNQVVPFSEQELSTFSRSKNAVRLLILFDVFVSAIFSMINFLFIVWFILSMIGWRGVKIYSPGLISIYFLHVPILIGVCIWLMVQDVSGLGIFGVFCIIFLILTQLSIVRDIFCFIQNCRRLTPEQKHYLINNNL